MRVIALALTVLSFGDMAAFPPDRITQSGWLTQFAGMDNNSVGAGYVGDNNDMAFNLREIWKPDRDSYFQPGTRAGAY